MSGDGPSFEERAARPRIRRGELLEPTEIRSDEGPGPTLPSLSPRAAHAQLVKELRQDVKATIDEWLIERSNTVSLAVAQLVEDAATRLQQVHSSRLAELQTQHEARITTLERENAEVLRAARRRRRASVRAGEQELREKIERLERSLTTASLEGIDRLRDVERREGERRLEMEQALQARIREKDEEIERLKRAAAGDQYYDSLNDQLRSRRTDRSGEQH